VYVAKRQHLPKIAAWKLLSGPFPPDFLPIKRKKAVIFQVGLGQVGGFVLRT